MTTAEARRRDALERKMETLRIDAQFVRAGHKPATPEQLACKHSRWTGMSGPGGRCCPDCWIAMVDPGD